MIIENTPYDALEIGATAELRRLCTADDLWVFAAATGNHNPMHLPDEDVDGDGKPEAMASGIYVASILSAVMGNLLPGPGTLMRSQSLTFHTQARAGDEILARVTVTAKAEGGVTLATEVRRIGDNALILSGEAQVSAPTRKLRFDDVDVPGLLVQRHRHFDAILKRAEPLAALITAVVCPHDANSLGGALLAMQHSIITPILIGQTARIQAVAAETAANLKGIVIIDAPSDAAAAQMAVDLVHKGRAQAIMKGHLHTQELIRPMMDKDSGLRIGRRFSHVFVMDVPGMDHPLLVSDAAINIAPDLATKVDIVQNAIDLAISLGMKIPRVGVLSAVETINPAIPSSIDAALLSKMAERGQITGGLVDGPLAMDNAVNPAAARSKNLHSKVAGRAQVLVVPGIDAGNMLAKQLTYLGHAEAAGLVLGAKVPVILTSRSDSIKARLAAAAIAAIHHHRLAKG